MNLEDSSTERIDLTWLVDPDNINITADDFAFIALVFGNTLNGALDDAEAELQQVSALVAKLQLDDDCVDLTISEETTRVARLRATLRTVNVFFEHLKKKNTRSLKGIKSNG